MTLQHQPSDDTEREYQLGRMFRALSSLDEAIQKAEEREARLTGGSTMSEDLKQRFPNFPTH